MSLTEEHFFSCPYCASENSLLVDFTAGQHQQFVTDCETCCRPICVSLALQNGEIAQFGAEME